MRKLLLSLLLAAFFTGVFAQKVDDVKEKISKGKFDEAKEKIDKLVADPKNQNNPDVWFYESVVYHNLAKANPADTTLSTTALNAMKKYMDLEKSKPDNAKMLLATLEGNRTFFDIYQDYFKGGVKNFQDKNYANAYYSFRGALDAFDYLSKYNLTPVKFDTTSTIYAGFSAQNAKMYDEAEKQYEEVVNAKIVDTNYIDIYTFLINYNLNKKDTAAAQKYLQIAESAFPNKGNMWLDYEISLIGNNSEKKIEKYESLLQRFPNNFSLAMDYAIELFNYTFTNEQKPADYTAREEKTKNALLQALKLDPNSTVANFVMSQYALNEVYDIDDSLRAVKGTTPAAINKRKELNSLMNQKYEDMYTYSQKAYDLYSAESNMQIRDKINYRKTISQLIDYYTRKKQNDKVAFYQDKLKQLK